MVEFPKHEPGTSATFEPNADQRKTRQTSLPGFLFLRATVDATNHHGKWFNGDRYSCPARYGSHVAQTASPRVTDPTDTQWLED